MTRPTTIDEVRQAYLDFFQAKDHLVVPSASLIPAGDPTLLFTSAGMVQFKSYFSGEERPPRPRLASSQKCFRTSDIDEVGDPKHLTFFEMLGNFSIGDYFKREAIAWAWEFCTQVLQLPEERLWITVFLDDDEAEAIWREIGVPPERILRYGEEHNYWGPAGEEGPCGPCSEIHYDYGEEYGPDATPAEGGERFVEIWNLVFTQFHQRRDGSRTPLPTPNIDTGMGLERTAAIMQDVRSVYQTDAFDYLVERGAELAKVRYGEDEEMDYALRVLAEHARAVTFLIADGVAPSNEGRGYVLRRILRRAVRYARKAGVPAVEGGFLSGMAEAVIQRMGPVYPELERERDFIYSVIRGEEQRFNRTIDAGTAFLEGMLEGRVTAREQLLGLLKAVSSRPEISRDDNSAEEVAEVAIWAAKLRNKLREGTPLGSLMTGKGAEVDAFNRGLLAFGLEKTMQFVASMVQETDLTDEQILDKAPKLSSAIEQLLPATKRIFGNEAFLLYDTYGFPPDITRDIAREHGLQIDMEGFGREMEAQRERGRASAKFGMGDAAAPEAYQTLATGESRFTGYDSLREETVVIGLLAGGAPVERASKGQQVEVVLRETPFYAEAGGQVGDTGQLRGPLGVVRITATHSPIQGLIAHAGEVTDGEIAVGEPVEASVDATRRDDVVRNHTGTHLLNAALRKVLGPHVRQAGSLVAPDRLRFDFSHPSAVTPAELQEIQALVNDTIMANLSVTHVTMPYKEAVDQGALAFFGEKYGDTVRTCRIARRSENGGDELFSFELCAGTHARATGEIGLLHVESEGSIAAGTRRIEAVTGRGADGALTQRHVLLESLAQQLQTSPAELTRRVASLLEDLDQERKRASSMERDLARRQAEALPAQAQTINGVTVLTAQVSAASPDALREMAGWLKERLGSAVIVLGADVNGRPSFVAMVTDDLTPKGYHAGNIVREVAKVADGGGGGRAEVAHAGGKDASKLQQALDLVPRLVKRGEG